MYSNNDKGPCLNCGKECDGPQRNVAGTMCYFCSLECAIALEHKAREVRQARTPKRKPFKGKKVTPKVVGKITGEIDCKRTYLPGLTIVIPCKNCGRKIHIDMKSNYLSYPVPGQVKTIAGSCQSCEDDPHFEGESYTEVQVRLNVSLELV